MDDARRDFLDELLTVAAPTGFEAPGQRIWLDYVGEFADEVRTDAYGNAVAIHEGGEDTPEGSGDAPSVALAGHADEIGLMVRDVTEEGFLKLSRVGGSDRTVTRGQHVTVHAADGPLPGVVGQVAIHLREGDETDTKDIAEMHVDVGAEDESDAREHVEVGDPITVSVTLQDLAGTKVAARAMDNRTGVWAAAEGFRRAVAADPDATVYAVSTVQEEIGHHGAKMVGFDLDPDVVIAADVTHATDTPEAPDKGSGLELGAGPVVARGSANHPAVVEAVREVAADNGIDVQLAATPNSTGTDTDDFYVQRGGAASLNLSIPNRYMHTPVEVIDTEDLDATAELMGRFAARADEFSPFRVDV